jgi:signal transduction histidine kinase
MSHDLHRRLPSRVADRRRIFPYRGSPFVESAPDPHLQLQRERHEAFVSTLVHELRQPLSALTLAASVLRAHLDESHASGALQTIERQMDRLQRLVDDVADVSRWANGRMTVRRERVAVRDLVNSVVLDARAVAESRELVLHVTIGSEPLWIDGDPDRLRQVVSNLLDNALKFTDPGGRIQVTATRARGEVIVRVRDTGRGIDPREQPHIFDLFSQVLPASGPGLGIGLSVVRQIVASHHGRVECKSPGVGRGSEFVVALRAAGGGLPTSNASTAAEAVL